MADVQVLKRDCTLVDFDKEKIVNAIMKAMKNGSGLVKPNIAETIADEIEDETKDKEEVSVSEIEGMVFDKLITKKQRLTARAYEGYRSIREFQRDNQNTIDEDIYELLDDKNEYWKTENANKNPMLNTTKRDYMAGIVSTDATRRYLLPPDIVEAHDEGILHFHDADYFAQHLHNCFHSATRFYTSDGIKSFAECSDGQQVRVIDKNGEFKDATIRKYGKQSMNEIVFTTAKREKTVICTENHRWLLKDGTVTTDLKIGDTLLGITFDENKLPSSKREIDMFALGFLIGDGCDHKAPDSGTGYHQIRLCGHKIEYASILEKAGYTIHSMKDTDDLMATAPKEIKQQFLDSYAWRYFNEDDRKWLFAGLYSADGAINSNKISTTDEREADLIRETSYAYGYYITSEFDEIRNTEYKKNSKLKSFLFTINQPKNLCWQVKSICKYHAGTEFDAWCVEEPTTHSFMLEGGMITGNCDLVNLDDMLQNGTMISDVLIEKPHSFLTACTVTTQIIAQVASSQYGGQTITLTHLAPFVDVSRKHIREEARREFSDIMLEDPDEHGDEIELIVHDRLQEEITKGIQTIQYQLTTIMTTNGQAPFITIFMYLNESKDQKTKDDLAWIIEETLKQREEGVKNEEGVFIAPAFPKLIYVLEEDNIVEGSKYWYLTELAAECSSKRLVPDYISEKMMIELKGDIYPCMGCCFGQEIVTYKFNNQLYTESFERMWNRLKDQYKVQKQNNGSDLYMDTDGVLIYDSQNGFVENQRIIRNISDNWMRIKFSNGRTLTCTTDHPFETKNRGIVLAQDLTEEDIIPIDRQSSFINEEEGIAYNNDRAWLLGFMLCDSSYASAIVASIAINGEDDIQDEMIRIVKEEYDLNVDIVERHRGAQGNYKDLKVRANENDDESKLRIKLESMFEGRAKNSRHIPNEVFRWNREARLSFLAGMIDADGYINSNVVSADVSVVQIGSTNQELALQQALLTQTLGMDASIYLNHYNSNKKDNIRYQVSFVPSDDLMEYIRCEKKKNHFVGNVRKNESIRDIEEAHMTGIESLNMTAYSYDVTTSSEHFTVSGILSHNCRSFLTQDRFTDANVGNIAKAKNYVEGEHKYYGRFNQGVVTLNLVDVALSSEGDFDKFWELMDERCELCHRALRIRHERLLGTPADVSPILWRYGALARLDKGEVIDPLLYNGYSTISLGYAGLYECVKYMTGHSHSDEGVGEEFGLAVMQKMVDKCNEWKAAENIDYSVYGTPLESTTYKFAKCLKKRFGVIEGITDRDYITNSYHIPVFEPIDAFEKLRIESKFQKLSPGGAISYIETPNMSNNVPALLEVIKFMYDNILYAEINTKSCYCEKCGYEGDIPLVADEDGKLKWQCPQCGNDDAQTMDIAFRVCGYIGTAKNGGNQGRYGDIHDRVYHMTDMEYEGCCDS